MQPLPPILPCVPEVVDCGCTIEEITLIPPINDGVINLKVRAFGWVIVECCGETGVTYQV